VSDLLLLGGKAYRNTGDRMPEQHTSAYWRDRAEEARAHAAEMLDPDSLRMMLEVASNYDKLAAYTIGPMG
jgi:hypothetical protein